jgi:hypothetical protein
LAFLTGGTAPFAISTIGFNGQFVGTVGGSGEWTIARMVKTAFAVVLSSSLWYSSLDSLLKKWPIPRGGLGVVTAAELSPEMETNFFKIELALIIRYTNHILPIRPMLITQKTTE